MFQHFGRVGQELREYWGNKASKGFAGPGLNGSRLEKCFKGHCHRRLSVVEAQAKVQRLLHAGPMNDACVLLACLDESGFQGGTSTSTRSEGCGRSSQSWMLAKAERVGPQEASHGCYKVLQRSP